MTQETREKENEIAERISTCDQIRFALEFYGRNLPSGTSDLTRTPIEFNRKGKKIVLSRSIIPWQVEAFVETDGKYFGKELKKDPEFYAALRERVLQGALA